MKKGKENNVFRRALSVLMAVMLCISSYTFQPMQVQAAQLPEYEIYPIPHEVTYQEAYRVALCACEAASSSSPS